MSRPCRRCSGDGESTQLTLTTKRGVPCRQALCSMTFPDSCPPLTSIHLEPPSTACPYPGTASKPTYPRRASDTAICTVLNTRRYHSRPKNGAASSSRSNTHNLTTKQRAPRSQKRAGAETTLRTAWIERPILSGFCLNNPPAGGAGSSFQKLLSYQADGIEVPNYFSFAFVSTVA